MNLRAILDVNFARLWMALSSAFLSSIAHCWRSWRKELLPNSPKRKSTLVKRSTRSSPIFAEICCFAATSIRAISLEEDSKESRFIRWEKSRTLFVLFQYMLVYLSMLDLSFDQLEFLILFRNFSLILRRLSFVACFLPTELDYDV